MSIADKLTQIAENTPKVYEAGKAEGIEEGKKSVEESVGERLDEIIETQNGLIGLESAPGIITPDYVSEGLLIEDGVIKGRGTCSDSVIVVPEEVTKIGMYAFNNDSTIDTLILPERENGVIISGYSIYESSLRVVKNFYSADSVTFIACPLEYVSFLPSCGRLSTDSYLFSHNAVILDFSRHTTIPILDCYGNSTFAEEMKILVPLELYDEWIAATNWTEIAEYIVPARAIGDTTDKKLDAVDAGVDLVHEAGKQAEYDAFWDEYQQKGERTHYAYAFAGAGWRKSNFKPKYPLDKVKTGIYMFNCFGFNDYSNSKFNLKQALEDMGIAFDTSNVSEFTHMFANAFIGTVPALDLSKAKTLTTFLGQSHVHTVDKLIVHSDLKYNNAFAGAPNLENITIEGTIGQSGLNMQYCTKLSKASIKSIISHLDTTEGRDATTITLSLAAVNKAFETSEGANDGADSGEFDNICASAIAFGNWTISLV